MKKVIFLKYSPLTKKVYDDYCMEFLSCHDCSVEYWDVTKLFKIGNAGLEEYVPDARIKVKTLQSYKEFESMVVENQTSFFISLMSCFLNQWRLLRILSQKKVLYASWGPAPLYVEKKSTSQRLRRVTFSKVMSVFGNYFMKFLLKTKFVRYYKYYFGVGKYGFLSIGLNDEKLLKSCKRLSVHSFDYNAFRFANDKQLEQNNYVVFIDQYFPFHPDFCITGTQTVPPEPYYRLLNTTLSKIEKELSVEIVIAAHPKAVKYKTQDFFAGRKVFFGETQSLIKNSQFVLAHSSTAIYFAIMAHKPICLLNADLFSKHIPAHCQVIKSLEKKFQLPVIKMESFDVKDFLQNEFLLSDIQKVAYDVFLYDFCTSSDISKPNQELLIKYLDEILNNKK